jgi:2-polyprenyl-6-methoxyphenol hydroxylase-like FAD-dependent oxidoreductase
VILVTATSAPSVPVLIAGGGSVGLTTSILLARHGVRSLVAERHLGTSTLPRAFGTNVRTMEIFRVLGLEEAIQAAEVDVGGRPLLLAMQTLDGPVLESVPFQNSGNPDDPAWPSPTRVSFCAQDILDPILAQALSEAGLAELRFGTEVSGLRPDPAGITAELTDRRDGTRHVIKADYLIAADGANSSIREALGIGMTGHDISAEINVLFEADLSRALGAKRAILYRLRNQWLPHGGLFRNIDGRNRWTMFTRDPGNARPARMAEIIRGCAGDPDLAVEILASGAWRKAAMIADRFRTGRVFLAGDAAHRLTPAGGLGLNTGIQGAHNLAWKLAAVLHGWAGPNLLDTYQAEWRPAAARAVELSHRIETTGHRAASKMLGQMLGTAYQQGAFVPDGTCPPDVADPVADYVPTARPGHRAPHHPLSCNGRRSTIDLFDAKFVALSPSKRWCDAARAAGSVLGVPLSAHVITDSTWAAQYEVGPDGAVLVRPDGYVAWRRAEACDDMPSELRRAIDTVLCRK